RVCAPLALPIMGFPRMIALKIAIAGRSQAVEFVRGWELEMGGELSDPVEMPAAPDLIGSENAFGIFLEGVSLIAEYVMAQREGFGRKTEVGAGDYMASSRDVRHFRCLFPSPHLIGLSGLVEIIMS